MSHVTNIILTLSLSEGIDDDTCYPWVDVLNQWLTDRGKGELHRVDDAAGGNKAMEAAVFMGAFNYLDIPEFIKAVYASDWEDRDGLSLFIKVQEADRFIDATPSTYKTASEHPALRS